MQNIPSRALNRLSGSCTAYGDMKRRFPVTYAARFVGQGRGVASCDLSFIIYE